MNQNIRTYAKLNEGGNKKTKENINNGESKEKRNNKKQSSR